jgi:hypothetical protein
MRGVNVGGNKVFQPSLLAKELGRHGVFNIGAAGTFIITGRCSQATLRAEILNRLAFPAELIICRGNEIIDLVTHNPFPRETVASEVRRLCGARWAARPRIRMGPRRSTSAWPRLPVTGIRSCESQACSVVYRSLPVP